MINEMIDCKSKLNRIVEQMMKEKEYDEANDPDADVEEEPKKRPKKEIKK